MPRKNIYISNADDVTKIDTLPDHEGIYLFMEPHLYWTVLHQTEKFRYAPNTESLLRGYVGSRPVYVIHRVK